ncbi:putative oxidoreductase YdbC [Frankia canadensis]|uniref:Putative oxidoreductase YdbC n=1 Tax=Frankia canadensis TaxID=1836972 RepID=A0A2I2KNL5_9ACTN|nr:aldo/keto reductase [Frankia canadensis]SNQ47246.1 putative oxidoreductase YdbC [Frankia canadensis]SOU54536.1 putative oxidoreductase YdbC [Frankia canadensis]
MSTTTSHATTSNDGATTATGSGTFRLGGDLPVTRLGFGAMRITGPGIWGPPANPDEARAVLRRAVELGVTFIDTADSYGPHVSEDLIAEALYPYPDDLVIATKGGLTRQGPNRWTPVARPAYLRQQVEMSLRRLRLDRIDLYQLHRIDPDTPVEDSLGELRALQQEGKIRHIGLSEVSVAELAHARTLVPIVSVQNRYNLVHRTAEDLLDYATRENIAFIPWDPVSTGRLAQPGGVLDTAARDHVASPVQLALAWLLRRSPTMLPIPGTSSVAHLEENIAAAAIDLTDKEFADLAQLGS